MEEYTRLEEEKNRRRDFLTEPTVSPQHIDEFNLKDETSFSEYDEEEQNVLYFNDLFPFNIIYPDDSKLNKDNDDKPWGDVSVIPLPDVINTNVGAYAQGSNKLWKTRKPLILIIKNLCVFGIPFDPKRLYKDGGYTRKLQRPRDRRHPYFRFEGLEYTDEDIANFEERLEKIYKRGVHRVHVFDFVGLTDLMAEGLSGRMLMEHKDAQGQSMFTSRA
nr:hypothetical protein [Tanacetum cinerariifolium]